MSRDLLELSRSLIAVADDHPGLHFVLEDVLKFAVSGIPDDFTCIPGLSDTVTVDVVGRLASIAAEHDEVAAAVKRLVAKLLGHPASPMAAFLPTVEEVRLVAAAGRITTIQGFQIIVRGDVRAIDVSHESR